jgi:putative endonuclease
MTGKTGYLSGLAAEDCVARKYDRGGFPILNTRWRGAGGEIDLIARDGDGLIFIEVKKSKSFENAAQKLTHRQMLRIQSAASEYLGTMPNGQLTDVRFDVALVNGAGDVQILENAFGH